MSAHLDDEQLSAHLDGEAGEDAREADEHLEACADCTGRLEQLRAVAGRIGRPPAPPTDARRDAAMELAVEAWSAARGAGGVPEAVVVPLPHRRVRPPLLAAAAAAAAVVTAVSLLSVAGGGDRGDTTAAPAPTLAGKSESALRPAGVDHRDLGDQPDAESLARAVEAALASPAGASRREAAPVAPDAVAAPATADGVACAGEARRLVGPEPELVYTGSVRFRGTPGVVLVFRTAPAPSDGADGARLAHRVVVMARDGCALLVAQAL